MFLTALQGAMAFDGDYCNNYPTQKHTSGRLTKQLIVAVTGGQTTTIDLQSGANKAIYWDKRDTKITVHPGDHVTVTTTGSGEWMHDFLYVDWNDDGQFVPNYDATTHTLQAGSELVAFERYTSDTTDPKTFYNDKGEAAADGHLRLNDFHLEFDVPEDQAVGEFTARFNVDWNSIDPCGNPGPDNLMTDNGGCIADFTLDVQAAPEKFALTLDQPEGATLKLFLSDETGTKGQETTARAFVSGQQLLLEVTPEEGYTVQSVTQDGDEISVFPLTADASKPEYFFTIYAASTVVVTMTQPTPPTPGVQAKGILVPAKDGSTRYEFRFDDAVLGTHTNNNDNANDQRARSFTMSAWVCPVSASGHLMGQAQKDFYDAEGTFGVGINDDGKLVLKHRSWISGGNCPGDADVVTDATLAAGEWAFITVVVNDETRNIYLYKNCELVGQAAIGNNGIGLLADEGVFFVGKNDFSVKLDEVQVWTKALTEDEITASAVKADVEADGLAALYQFDENTTTGTFANKAAMENNAELVSGTIKYVASRWANVYTCSPVTSVTLTETHPAFTPVQKFTVTVPAAVDYDGGTLTVRAGSQALQAGENQVSEGTELTIIAQPFEDYHVNFVKVNDETLTAAADKSYTYTVTANAAITVEFAEDQYFTVTVPAADSYENGTLTVKNGEEELAAGDHSLLEGTELTIKAEPAEGYMLDYVKANGTKLTSETYTVTEDAAITVAFKLGEYCNNYPTAKNGHSRRSSSLTFNCNNTESVIPGQGDVANIYVDSRASKATVFPGQHVVVTVQGNGEWMHGYLYADWNRDFVFDNAYDAATHKPATDEILDVTYYKGYNGKGEAAAEHQYIDQFQFEFDIPEDRPAGDYTARYLCDWNYLDPCGQQHSGSNGNLAANGGAIIDFTISVVAPDYYDVTVPAYNLFDNGTVLVKDGDTSLSTGIHNLVAGTQLTIVPTPNTGYYTKSVKANEEEIVPVNGVYTYSVQADTRFEVEFARLLTLTLPETVENGELTVWYNDGNDTFEPGLTENIQPNTEIDIDADPAEGYAVEYVRVNGVDLDTTGDMLYTITENTEITVSFTNGTGISSVQLSEQGVVYRNGQLFATGRAEVFTTSGTRVMVAEGEQINLSNLPAGAYIIKAGDKAVKVMKK